MIRSGVTPDVADDIIVKRFSGNPKLWGIVLTVLGAAFLLQNVFNLRFLMRGLLPLMLIGLGIYILRGYIFKPKTEETKYPDFDANSQGNFVSALTETRYRGEQFDSQDFETKSRFGAWKSR